MRLRVGWWGIGRNMGEDMFIYNKYGIGASGSLPTNQCIWYYATDALNIY